MWSWQSVGFLHAGNDENYRKTFGPRYQLKLEVLVDGQPQEIVPEVITQQLDCRTTAGKSANVEFHSTAMILAVPAMGGSLAMPEPDGQAGPVRIPADLLGQ